jgi:hypothetical protein
MRTFKATVAVMATAVIFSSLASPAFAFTERFDNLISHFLDCKLLLLTDLDAHARECGGGKVINTLQSLSEKVENGPVQTVVTQPSGPTEPECPYEEGSWKYYCECRPPA